LEREDEEKEEEEKPSGNPLVTLWLPSGQMGKTILLDWNEVFDGKTRRKNRRKKK